LQGFEPWIRDESLRVETGLRLETEATLNPDWYNAVPIPEATFPAPINPILNDLTVSGIKKPSPVDNSGEGKIG